MKVDLYQQVTDKIIAELEAGAAPWVKPWKSLGKAGSAMPHNAVTRRPYSGVNVLLLWGAAAERGYTATGWLTFKQCAEAGGHVRKGEKATLITFVKQLAFTEKDGDGKVVTDADDNAETRAVHMLKSYYVFNVEQCDGLPEKLTGKLEPVEGPTDPEFDAWATRTGATIRIGGDRACYQPSSDQIVMPARAAFVENANYNATLIHELGHWTGHKSRLDRNLRGRFGDSEYAAEELIAELTAAFLCAELNIDGDLRHAGYIQHWLKMLKTDKRAIFTAASAATKAATFLREAAEAQAMA